MREKDFEMKVRNYLINKGCWVLKTWSNGVQREGVPDLLVCCNGYFLGVEVKAENGHPSTLQLRNIRLIREAGGIAMVLYPDQFEEFAGTVGALLSGDNTVIYDYDKRLTERERNILYESVCYD